MDQHPVELRQMVGSFLLAVLMLAVPGKGCLDLQGRRFIGEHGWSSAENHQADRRTGSGRGPGVDTTWELLTCPRVPLGATNRHASLWESPQLTARLRGRVRDLLLRTEPVRASETQGLISAEDGSHSALMRAEHHWAGAGSNCSAHLQQPSQRITHEKGRVGYYPANPRDWVDKR